MSDTKYCIEENGITKHIFNNRNDLKKFIADRYEGICRCGPRHRAGERDARHRDAAGHGTADVQKPGHHPTPSLPFSFALPGREAGRLGSQGRQPRTNVTFCSNPPSARRVAAQAEMSRKLETPGRPRRCRPGASGLLSGQAGRDERGPLAVPASSQQISAPAHLRHGPIRVLRMAGRRAQQGWKWLRR